MKRAFLAGCALLLLAGAKWPKTKLTADEQAEHLLSRLTFGARPGDAAEIQRVGVKKWIDRQMHPDLIGESPRLIGKLSALKTINESPAALAQEFPLRGEAQARVATIGRELTEAKVYRALYSERQLEEVLVDFWFNHFNVNFQKGAGRYLTADYERTAIRPHVFGHFGDLLRATAEHPAMLFYLDNWQSTGPQIPRRGLNENYARELMELHTLGVEGGYTQKDVTEVARCFTGWTIRNPREGGGFRFAERMHDAGAKVVLGVTIPAGGGQKDGLRVLEVLETHPSTARFISRKLAQRFVSDDPPQKLVERMAGEFRKTHGDLRAVYKVMFESPEFWSKEAYRAKIKSPLEYVAGAGRALDADVTNALPLVGAIGQMGMPLYRKQEPTGYPNTTEQWLNAGTLAARVNFVTALAANRLPGVKVEAGDAGALTAPEFQRR